MLGAHSDHLGGTGLFASVKFSHVSSDSRFARVLISPGSTELKFNLSLSSARMFSLTSFPHPPATDRIIPPFWAKICHLTVCAPFVGFFCFVLCWVDLIFFHNFLLCSDLNGSCPSFILLLVTLNLMIDHTKALALLWLDASPKWTNHYGKMNGMPLHVLSQSGSTPGANQSHPIAWLLHNREAGKAWMQCTKKSIIVNLTKRTE